MKKAIALAAAVCCFGTALSGCGTTEQDSREQAAETTEEQGEMRGERNGGRGGNGGGMIDKSGDEDLAALLAQTRDKFKQIDYTDDDTGMSFSYNLLEPDSYDESEVYPLILFITDSSVVGNDTTAALEQGYGALVWATDEEQAKHPSFVIAPEYPENILEGEDGTTDYVQATLNLLASIQEQYSIDADRLYITGQSMGCMTALYLNGTYPDMFAASIFVDGQWSTDILAPLEDQNFFYFAAEGDDRASEGMANVMAMFDADGVSYGTARLNAKDDSETIAAAISDLIDEGYNANFISWEEGSVLPDGVEASGMGGEHMYSFDHPYKISTLRDWLFEQSK